ncbi:MAG: hypothetical protein QJR02_07950 [Sinobacteraceae bacterium]|nr:hypothetical protein [Nevskiaceae bacterium]
MTRIKDKLTESVRQAQRAKPEERAQTARVATRRKTAPGETPSKSTAPAHTSSDDCSRDEPAASAHLLFPERIWPD